LEPLAGRWPATQYLGRRVGALARDHDMRRDRDVTRHNRFRSLFLVLLLAGVLCWQPEDD